ncbi:hypothetical protein FO440_09890 [Mucilaginibacter corticis]|uniref:DUF3108 domain-containing protein n=1 Tax=Mucilaginibacter corticis TaxID=2597670 RepID=A0A556MX16_9SPHI|nr:hypothetical protein [Mucilaginibacter corticis]TSJ44466.1 hypothetical protein FO440_09890 [Mucilaginibacter corticis]
MKKIIIPILLITLSTSGYAQTDTIRLPGKALNTAWLKPGMRQYMIVITDPRTPKSRFLWYWMREIKKEQRSGQLVFTTTQHWYASDTLRYRQAYSINRASDFAPIYHKEMVQGKTGAYNWTDSNIVGADSVANNFRKDFKLDFHAPNYNWNVDIEIFEMLPLAAGKVFAINFYDAGLSPPEFIKYTVIGSEVLNYGGKQVDCWKLFTKGTSGKITYSETYWISKAGHDFLREEDDYGQGMHRSKIRMPVNVN